MSTTIRPVISEKNQYWIDRHRYYELKHFCLQYLIWKRARAILDNLNSIPTDGITFKTNNINDPTAKCAEARLYYTERIEMIEKAARETGPDIADYILKAVTENISYNSLRTLYNIPFCKELYYNFYRRFFWILSNARK